jgi:lipid II:glycine glycyltransferase (peptidoglycan interpeptide bridge formation enzyme)
MSFEPTFDVDDDAWDAFSTAHPGAHVLQTGPWGTLKSQFGWDDQRVGLTRDGELVAGALLLYRELPTRLGRLAYVPRGPLVDWSDEAQCAALWRAMDQAARDRGAIALMVEPDLPGNAENQALMRGLELEPAPLTVQPRRTLVVDLTPDEEDILMAMKSKTRYNIRLAGRKGVTVREARAEDLPTFNALMETTGERNEFGVHAPAYYAAAYELFVPQDMARMLLAAVEGEAVAALMVFALGADSWYFYGASSNVHREKMPTYLLQWEAMCWAKRRGCTAYDMWGVPDADRDKLEDEFTSRGDGLWGVYRFKRGFGGELWRSVGAWDRVYAPMRYKLYRNLVSLREQVPAFLRQL